MVDFYDQETIEMLRQINFWKDRLQAAEQRAAEAEAHLRAVLEVEWSIKDDYGKLIVACPWCHHSKAFGHRDCPRQAAAAWLEAGEGKE